MDTILQLTSNLKNNAQHLIEKSYHNGSSSIFGNSLHIKETPKFYTIIGDKDRLTGREYVFAKIDKITGDIYSQAGKIPHGNLNNQYNGLDCIDQFGVIVNKDKKQNRLKELISKNAL